MENDLQKLPIGIQSFKKLKTNNYLYVDKTKDIYNLILEGTNYFLSRPRRFGKSLLISTLENLFLGKKELFKDLYIYDKWNWNKTYPVIRIDFSGGILRSGDDLKYYLIDVIEEIAELYNITLKHKKVDGKFRELIKNLYGKHGKVVVLVDEYDKPVLDNISYPTVRDEMKEILHDFYQILKSQDDNLRFVFLTGVSKFVGTSIFSGLNNLIDITLSNKFSTICGYTQDELENYFKLYIVNLSKEFDIDVESTLLSIKEWYNGYSWDGKNFVYNPQSTLSLFGEMEFNNYWFKTGTPTFLLEILKGKNTLNKIFSQVEAGSEILDAYDPENIPLVPLMFQSGYLTIHRKEIIDLRINYLLSIPNTEVKDSLIKYLMNISMDYPLNQVNDLRDRMRRNFLNMDDEGLNFNLREMLASIPYNLYNDNEAYFHSIFLLWLNLLGFKIEGEVITNIGQMDAVLIIEDLAIIVEIKFGKNKNKIDDLLVKALNQIKDNRYYEKYLKHDLVFLGVVFADNEVKCEFKRLNI
ncbi:MAG: ATP-binding protein [Methanobrevibacter sp.]|nr:ATP-binding protein [Candidatus Methanovirga procula]